MSKYTSAENIARKLKGRLNIDIGLPGSGYPNDTVIYPIDTPNQLVDEILLKNIIDEQEELLDLTLSQIYNLPLQQEHTILRTIIDNLVISELIEIHFLGNAGYGSLSVDLGQYGSNARSKAYQLLGTLVAGYNVAIIGAPIDYQQYGQDPRRKLTLPNETYRMQEPERILDYFTFEIGKIGDSSSYDARYLIEEDQIDNPFSGDYRPSSQYYYEED